MASKVSLVSMAWSANWRASKPCTIWSTWVQQFVTCKNTGGAKWKTRFGFQDYMLKHHGMVSEDSKAQWAGMLADHSAPKMKIGDHVRMGVMKDPRRAPKMVAPSPRS